MLGLRDGLAETLPRPRDVPRAEGAGPSWQGSGSARALLVGDSCAGALAPFLGAAFSQMDVVRELPAVAGARTFVGLAGTVSTVAAVELGLATYDRDAIHHLELTHEAVEDVFRTLATETRVQRLENPGMEAARADVIVGGCCILVKLMRHYGLSTCLVSEADILDGLVAFIA